MRYRCVPPDPSEFPRIRLVAPALVPLAFVIVGMVGSGQGHLWNVHGDGALLLGAIVITGIAAFFITLVTFVRGLVDLVAYSSLRTSLNIGCVSLAGAFLVTALVGVARG